MAGIIAYMQPEDSSYVALSMQNDDMFKATIGMMEASGIVPIVYKENLSQTEIAQLELKLNKVLSKINSEPISMNDREIMIKDTVDKFFN